jgi:5-methylcytosine-specific restriction endonuclease McrA
MSQHHIRTKHTTAAPGIRRKLAAMLPLPCVECGNPVTADQSWHVAHIVPAAQGGRTTTANTGVAHARCNLVSGGKLGAATVNRKRRAESDAATGRRRWY